MSSSSNDFKISLFTMTNSIEHTNTNNQASFINFVDP